MKVLPLFLLCIIGNVISYPIINIFDSEENDYYKEKDYYKENDYYKEKNIINKFTQSDDDFIENIYDKITQTYNDNYKSLCYEKKYPTVLMHGILANKNNLNDLKEMLEKDFEITVYNLEIGNGATTSLYKPMKTQLEMLCETIYAIDDLKNGFNFIGMSQGGLLARGYVEYCNKYPVRNLITLVSPNAGVYHTITYSLNFYNPLKQNELSFTNYWRDPYRYELYLENSTYLAQLNNEIPLESEQNNLDVVDNFVMVWSAIDDVVKPPESAKFSMYEIKDNILELVDLFDTDLYNADFLKLKTMNEQGRLFIHETNCLHSEHRDIKCYEQLYNVFEKYLL